MKSIIVLFLAATIFIFENHLTAQQVTSASYPVITSTMSGRVMNGEKKCQYFFYTTILGPSDPHIAFTFVLPDGKTDDEMLSIKDLIVITDKQQETPTVREIGLNDAGRQRYELHMSATIYNKEAGCLTGVEKK